MPTFHSISRQRHGHLCWARRPGYLFAARNTTAPLVAAELPHAVMSLPIAFVAHTDGFTPAAVMSLVPEKNLFVSQNGSWAGDYIPASLRSHPFCLGTADDGKKVLCLDETSLNLSEGPNGERFFYEDGQPSAAIKEVLTLLNAVENSRLRTVAACAALQKHGLIVPWPAKLKSDAGEQPIEGLFQIDEIALNQLPGDALQELNQTGALLIAHCQLLSKQHLPLLGQLIDTHARTDASFQNLSHAAKAGELDLEFLNKGGTISFANLF